MTTGGRSEVEVAGGQILIARPGQVLLAEDRNSRVPSYFLFQTPQDSERVATFPGADESALFRRFDGIAIGGQRAYSFTIFQPPQNWVAAERISFKLASVLDVRKFRQEVEQFSSSPFVTPVRWRLVLNLPQWDYWGTRLDNIRHAAAKADTTGYARVFQRVSDSQPRGRRRTAV
jgi:hypothetical protein